MIDLELTLIWYFLKNLGSTETNKTHNQFICLKSEAFCHKILRDVVSRKFIEKSHQTLQLQKIVQSCFKKGTQN